MAKWEGVSSPMGPIGEMGLAVATPEEIASMKDYTMPTGRKESVKVASGKRKPTDQVTLVTADLGDLSDGRKVLSLVTLYPGGMDVDGVTIPNDRGAFADAGIYFVLPSGSPILGEGKLKITKKQLRKIIKEEVGRGSSVSFDWSPSGMTMHMHVNGNKVMSFSTQKEVRDLISDLEELLAGPMSMSP